MPEQIVRLHPRISANKLGEYLVSPPLRRRDIIEYQKYPRSFVGAYYEPARLAILGFLLGRVDRVGMLGRMEALVSAEHTALNEGEHEPTQDEIDEALARIQSALEREHPEYDYAVFLEIGLPAEWRHARRARQAERIDAVLRDPGGIH